MQGRGSGTLPAVNRRRLSLSLLVVLTTVAAGCGSDDDSPSADDTTSVTGAPVTADTDAAGTTDAPPTTDDDDDVTTTSDTPPDTSSPDTSDTTSASTSPAERPGVDSEFCTTAAEAEALGDEVDPALAAGPQELEEAVTAAVAGSEATLELAPEEIADLMATNVDFQRRLADILAEYDWDADVALTTPDGEELLAEREEIDSDLAEVRAYLEENCGIEDDSDSDEPDDATAMTLPAGDEGLRRFIQLYSIGASVDVSQEQEDCFVEELSGEVEVEQLELALSGEAPEAVNMAVGLAVLGCGIEVSS
jgi:hypothetical protein